MRVEHQSTNARHLTPEPILERVRRIDGIGLDPASCEGNPTGARVYFTPRKDGLVRTWCHYGGIVFVNPPYGRRKGWRCQEWVDKAIAEAANGAEIVMLLPARTDTRWFQRVMCTAPRIVFVRGRITFQGQDNGAPFPSALVYFGHRPDKFEAAFVGMGHIVGTCVDCRPAPGVDPGQCN